MSMSNIIATDKQKRLSFGLGLFYCRIKSQFSFNQIKASFLESKIEVLGEPRRLNRFKPPSQMK